MYEFVSKIGSNNLKTHFPVTHNQQNSDEKLQDENRMFLCEFIHHISNETAYLESSGFVCIWVSFHYISSVLGAY